MDQVSAPDGQDRPAGTNGRHRARRARRDDGASLVEFALILPVLLMLIVGMFSGGIAYNQKLDMTHAAREGARYGATIPTTQTFSEGATWSSTIRDYVVDRSSGTLTPGQVCVALVQNSPPTVVGGHVVNPPSAGQPCFSDAYPVNPPNDLGRRVQVRVARPGSIDLGIFPSVNFTMTSQAVAKSESNQ